MIYLYVFSLYLIFNLCYAYEPINCGDWETFKDEKCYNIIENITTFEVAKTSCFDLDESNLITIRSQEEQHFLFHLLKDVYEINNVWIGIEFKVDEYKWTDSSALDYTNWAPGFPVNNSGYDCVQMVLIEPFNGQWFNIPCRTKNLFVCEKQQIWQFKYLQKSFMEYREIIRNTQIELRTTKNELKLLKQTVSESTPPGTIAYFTNTTVPKGWLKANGELVSRTTYANLFATIGIIYGSGDGSTTFTLPDLRGEFIRGWSDSRDVDKDRDFGSFQWGSHIPFIGYINNSSEYALAAAYQNRYRFAGNTFDGGMDWDVPSGRTIGGLTLPTNDWAGNWNSVNFVTAANKGWITSWNVFKGTRPRNIALLACIKY